MNTSPKKHSIYLSLKIQATRDKSPDIVVRLNEIICEKIESHNDIIKFTMFGNFGNNLLTISMNNKTPDDTVLDSDGQIIQDLNVQLLDLKIDNISIIDYAKQKNVYVTTDGTIENTYGFMHKNGTMSISMIFPTFYMLRNDALVNSN